MTELNCSVFVCVCVCVCVFFVFFFSFGGYLNETIKDMLIENKKMDLIKCCFLHF